MSRKPKRQDLNPKKWAEREDRVRGHQAVDKRDEALAECYRVLMETDAIKPKAKEER